MLPVSSCVPFLSLPVPPTCLWHTCVMPGLTPAFVNRGRRRAQVIGEREEREKGLHSDKPTGEVDRRTAGGKRNEK